MVSEDYIIDSSDEEYYSSDSSGEDYVGESSEDVGESSADYSSSSSEDHSSNLSEHHVKDSEFYGGNSEEPGSIAEKPGSNSNSFEQLYRCYPVSFINKEHIEKGDNSGRVAHCGVLEFVADEGLMYLPYWIMKKLLLQEGDLVQVKNKSLVKGIYMKLQPHTMNFLDVSDPKAILETALRSYSCLATGDTIMVPYNNKEYYIDVIETKPSPAISIIDTDCEVDFAPPLDYVEPQKPGVPSTQSMKRSREARKEEEPPEKIPKFSPFTGSARRLDGKPTLDQPVASVSSLDILKQNQLESENGTKASMSSTSVSAHRPNGELVFGKIGSNANRPRNETPKVDPENSSQEQFQKAEKPKL